MTKLVEAWRRHEERVALQDGTAEWLERARAQRKAQSNEDHNATSSWSLLEEYARLGVMPSNGRRVPKTGFAGDT